MPEFTGHQDLRSTLQLVWRWRLVFLVFLVGTPLVAYVIERGKPNLYQSSALVGIDQATVNTAVLSGSSGSFSTSNVTAIAELVTAPGVADIAAGLLHPPANPGDVAGEVSATGDSSTNFVTITAEDHSPARAAAVANAFARALSLNREQAAIGELNDAARGVRAQLARLKNNSNGARAQLEEQLNQLLAARSTQGSNAAILRPATPSGTPVAPNVRRGVEVGLLIGLLLAVGAVALAENIDRRIRTPDELEDMADTPLLATIAPSAFSARLDTTAEDEEAFHMLRIALTAYHAERPISSIVIASPAEKEGKTTVAGRLAVAMARAGMSVILVDADLRRGRLTQRLGIQSRPGLSGVLANELPLTEALVDHPIDDVGSGRLSVVPAGRTLRRASTLISSPEMTRVIDQLSSGSDVVIIDTPAALAVSDSLALMRNVSGAIVVARMNVSRRRPFQRLVRMITAAHGTVLGVVAVGVTSGSDYYYGYSTSYHHENGSPTGPGERFRRRVGQPD